MYKEDWHTSKNIAGSLNVNPVLVRKELANLKKGGLIESKEGKNGGVRLLKDAKSIYLSDIFMIAKGDNHVLALSSNTPNPACRVGKQINENLDGLFDKIDASIYESLKDQTLESFKNQF